MADIINFPWIRNPDRRNINLADYPNVKRWHDAMADRPAVQRGCEVLSEKQRQGRDDRRGTRGHVRQDTVRGALNRDSARDAAAWHRQHPVAPVDNPHGVAQKPRMSFQTPGNFR